MRIFPSTCHSKLILAWNGPLVFYQEDVRSIPEGLPGVYVLCAFTIARAVLVPFYVGQSACLRRRLTEHLVGDRTFARHLRSRLSTYFSVAVVLNPALRTAAEAALIRMLAPAGNEVVPAAPAVTLNRPPLSLLDP